MHDKSCLASTVWSKECNAFSAFNAKVDAEERLVAIRISKCQIFD
jgi:hypothetical protein